MAFQAENIPAVHDYDYTQLPTPLHTLICMHLFISNIACAMPCTCSFWKNLSLHPPLYGADVMGSLFDGKLKVRCLMNSSR